MDNKKIFGTALAAFLIFQASLEKAVALPLLPTVLPTALPTIAPVSNPITNAATQPEQNLNADARNPSIASQLLNLLGQGAVGVQGPASSELIFAVLAPLSYNTNPGLAPEAALPAWDFDPEVELLHSAPLGEDLLLTEILEADTAIYFDNSGYNLNTVSGQIQVNFTDQGIHFDASPFVAYRVGYTVPANFSGHAWVNDVEIGYNFNRILDSGVMDPLEIDFNPGIS
ncbi:MAG TPA: hypothetical protein VN963_04100, partial [bacterium]|nr:hypothetical protein [bacterium]